MEHHNTLMVQPFRCFAFIGLCATGVCFSATPGFVGKFDVKAPIVSAQASEDGRRIVIQVQASEGRSAELQIFDKGEGSIFEKRGFLSLKHNGEFVLSPDGRKALVRYSSEKPQFNKPIRHSIIEIDLASSGGPAEKRAEVMARRIVLAPDASAYAASEPSAKDGRWRTRLHRVGDARDPVIIEEDQYFEPQKLSARGQFLLYMSFNRVLQIHDLRASQAAKYEQAFTSIHRYQCVVSISEDGHVLVEDARLPRLGVYAANEGMPRVGVVEHTGGPHCTSLGGKDSSRPLVLVNSHRELSMVKAGWPKRLELSGHWTLPAGIHPLALSADTLFAAGGEGGKELHVLHLQSATLPEVAWPELESAYREIMVQYRQDTVAKKPIPYFYAFQKLEGAGVRSTLEAPIAGISPQRAAAILNDYGFLLARMGGRDALAERALKRAIALDPKRAVAYLNLGDLQRQTLPQYTTWKGKTARSLEAANNYKTFIALGGKMTQSIASFLKGDLPGADGNDDCSAIANYANAGRLGELLAGSGANISVDGRKMDLVFTTEGTAHVPSMNAFDAITDHPLKQGEKSPPLPPNSENLWGGDNLALLVYRNGEHIINYRDLAHPVASVSLADGRTCEFAAEVKQLVGVKASEPELCRHLMAGSGGEIEPMNFDGPVWMTPEDVRQRWSETGMVGTCIIDFANDGKPANVAQLGLTSGAGAGCDETFFDLVDKNATRFASDPRRDLLMELQGAHASNRFPILPCGNIPMFFKYKGKIYFENKWQPTDTWHQQHRVARAQQGRVIDVCDFKFETRITSK